MPQKVITETDLFNILESKLRYGRLRKEDEIYNQAIVDVGTTLLLYFQDPPEHIS